MRGNSCIINVYKSDDIRKYRNFDQQAYVAMVTAMALFRPRTDDHATVKARLRNHKAKMDGDKIP